MRGLGGGWSRPRPQGTVEIKGMMLLVDVWVRLAEGTDTEMKKERVHGVLGCLVEERLEVPVCACFRIRRYCSALAPVGGVV